jgi:hypothetical protein
MFLAVTLTSVTRIDLKTDLPVAVAGVIWMNVDNEFKYINTNIMCLSPPLHARVGHLTYPRFFLAIWTYPGLIRRWLD